MKINSIDKDIKSVLSSNFYMIPRFQRPYSWDRENIAEFWNDVVADSESDYFIGSIVVFKTNDFYGIVDGQQRLTTITMLLCAMRNILKQEGFLALANGVHALIERKNIEDQSQFVLATESSYPYFQEYIQKFEDRTIEVSAGDEEKNLESAFTIIKSYITESVDSVKKDPSISEENKSEKIKEKLIIIRDQILKLKLIFIELDNEDDAYVIFETLNTRGKDLNVSDLFKNHITKNIKPKNPKIDTPKIQWERIQSILEGSVAELDVDSFLHHFWLSKHDYVTIKKLFKAIRKNVRKNNAQTFLNELEADSVTYREMQETGYKKWSNEEKNIKYSLDALTVFRVKQQIPMVLAIMREYKKKNLKNKNVRDILAAIENFHFIFTAVTSQRSSGGISQMYASAAKKLTAANGIENKIRVLDELKNKIRGKIPSYEEFEINFKEILHTNKLSKNKKLVKYILSKIDKHSQNSYVIDYDSMTIEHLASQNSENQRLDDKIVGQIGNLILITTKLNNDTLKNKPFHQKKKILQEKQIALDEQIEKATQWGKKEIEKRTSMIAKLAYERIWHI